MYKNPSNPKENVENSYTGCLFGFCPSHKYNWNGSYVSLLLLKPHLLMPFEWRHFRIMKQLETWNHLLNHQLKYVLCLAISGHAQMNWTDAMLWMAVHMVPYEQHPSLWQKLINYHTQLPNLPPIQNINKR